MRHGFFLTTPGLVNRKNRARPQGGGPPRNLANINPGSGGPGFGDRCGANWQDSYGSTLEVAHSGERATPNQGRVSAQHYWGQYPPYSAAGKWRGSGQEVVGKWRGRRGRRGPGGQQAGVAMERGSGGALPGSQPGSSDGHARLALERACGTIRRSIR